MKMISMMRAETPLKMRKVVFTAVLFIGWLASLQSANAATAYYVSAQDVYARSKPQSYAMGRLYNHTDTGQGRIDIQYVDANGWGYGYAYGYVNRCVWVQYSYRDDAGVSRTNFRTNGTTVSNKCRTTNIYLDTSEFTNGEIFMNSNNTDGVIVTTARDTNAWDNWRWDGTATGNSVYRGVSPAGSKWKVRYTTKDGAGVMARPCSYDAAGSLSCASDWHFIQRSSF